MSDHFTDQQARDAFVRQGGLCTWCGLALGRDTDRDHVVARSLGGSTDDRNLHLLHRDCHRQKTRIYDGLRPWQMEATDLLHEHGPQTFLVQADVGAGKTHMGMAAFDRFAVERRNPLLIVCAPSVEILRGWAKHAVQRGPTGVVNLDSRERQIESQGRMMDLLSVSTHPARDDRVLLLTYQSLQGMSGVLSQVCRSRDVFVILDEVHHVESSDEAVWGPSAEYAFAGAAKILALSATPFRSNRTRISFLDYDEDGFAVPSFVFSMEESILLGYTIPAEFIHGDARAEWRLVSLDDPEDASDTPGIASAPGGSGMISDRESGNTALNVALDELDFVLGLVREGQRALAHHRDLYDVDACGLIVVKNQAMAHRLGRAMNNEEPGSSLVAVSDNPDAHRTIEQFKNGRTDARWLIACGMVSEGCDIPALSVLVYATWVKTRIAFKQLVGRVIRMPGTQVAGMQASVILPNHLTLSEYARQWLALQPLAVNSDEDGQDSPAEQDGARPPRPLVVGVGVGEIALTAVTADGARLPVEERIRRAATETGLPLNVALDFAQRLGVVQEPVQTTIEEVTVEPPVPALSEHEEKVALRAECQRAAKRIIRRTSAPASHIWTEAYERAEVSPPLKGLTARELRGVLEELYAMGGRR